MKKYLVGVFFAALAVAHSAANATQYQYIMTISIGGVPTVVASPVETDLATACNEFPATFLLTNWFTYPNRAAPVFTAPATCIVYAWYIHSGSLCPNQAHPCANTSSAISYITSGFYPATTASLSPADDGTGYSSLINNFPGS